MVEVSKAYLIQRIAVTRPDRHFAISITCGTSYPMLELLCAGENCAVFATVAQPVPEPTRNQCCGLWLLSRSDTVHTATPD